MLKLRFKSNAPRRPPRILLLGSPGSGTQTQGKALAEYFGLVNVSVRQLLKDEIRRNPDGGKAIVNALDNGHAVQDNVINNLVLNRINQSDCKVNGWIIEGFPKSKGQYNMLKQNRIKPSSVLVLDIPEEESVKRLENRVHDPHTGLQYNLESNPPRDEAVSARVIKAKCDDPTIVKKRYKDWKDTCEVLEENFKDAVQSFQADRAKEIVTE